MCGIVAIVERERDRPVSLREVEQMVRRLVHRGPDEQGTIALGGVGLGMRRLSIVDLSGGQQPFASEDGSVLLVANGEIYNCAELREALAARGHRFRSRSDIEVLVHAYEEWGEAFLARVRGMFALALWDGRTRTLVAARDRAGEKPLYYAVTPEGLRLASEIKALLARPEVPRELDLEGLDQFLTYEYIPAPRTIFRHVQKLPAAHLLVYREGRLEVRRYWDAAAVVPRPWTEAEAAAALRVALERAVAGQMMADVPVGAFLSGGVDSSAVVAFMVRAARARGGEVQTFSMGFADGTYNELPYAREVAAHFGTRHREGMVTPDLVDLVNELVVHLDEPFADVSLFPTYLVSRLAREHVKVALTGDGGDELFGGYDTYVAERLARRLAPFTPPVAVAILDRLAALWPPSEKKKGFVNKVKRFLHGWAHQPAAIEHYRWMTFLGPSAKRRLYTAALRAALAESDVYRPVREAIGRVAGDDWINRQLYADFAVYLADDILVKVDRMSMATSLETRAPFLDVDVMELAFSMPGWLKVRGGARKVVLRRALDGVVPARVLTRPKEGFSIPMKTWLRRDLQPLLRDLLAPERLRRRGLFEPAEVERLIREHLAGRENHAHVLFGLMVFERWAEEFLA
jgi:asparagine synthase (glutamine-hydrolysing)